MHWLGEVQVGQVGSADLKKNLLGDVMQTWNFTKAETITHIHEYFENACYLMKKMSVFLYYDSILGFLT